MSLLLALLLDAALGEPKWLWDRLTHPAILIGRLIGWADARYNQGQHRRAKGILLALALVIGASLTGSIIAAFGTLPEAIAAAILLAQKSLIDHVRAVAEALRRSTAEGRAAVAMIVGRDTAGMDDPAIARAAIESAAENFSDGITAPVFWFLLGGLPGMLVYKAINTADSMVGYRTPQHEAFGWASARLDDLMNLIPARLTALMILLAARHKPDWQALIRDAGLHRSPNAGWPEAAISRALGIALSGPRSYHGEMRDFPWVSPTGRKAATAEDIDRAIRLIWHAWALLLIPALALTLF
ncbi:adenosylcobinamide-phosphate synthase CbiB [Pseudooceanicola sp. C21-150M6]|uniref:adenosylcobinamide-phosphate synthase CbiB n=1 Tax=Pseudooceanicola sp. C21-150M6 TaxID=3434355 RepID=UPI003D7FAD97